MNGRMYDPVVGRMLSTDNNINGTYSILGYDRYSYALNNPLKYTDPSGENPLMLVGAIIGGTLNVINQALSGNISSFGEGLAYFVNGAIAGAMYATPGLQGAAGAFLATSNKVIQFATGRFNPSDINSVADVGYLALDVVGDFFLPASSVGLASKTGVVKAWQKAGQEAWQLGAKGGGNFLGKYGAEAFTEGEINAIVNQMDDLVVTAKRVR